MNNRSAMNGTNFDSQFCDIESQKSDTNGTKSQSEPNIYFRQVKKYRNKFLMTILTAIALVFSQCVKRTAELTLEPKDNHERPAFQTIIVSIDGFAPRLISEKGTPFLYELVHNKANFGVNTTHAKYMSPSFPSQTFPNHWSMITGDTPSNHGLVSNIFHDPITGKLFTPAVLDPDIWSQFSKPIWNILQNITDMQFKVAAHMWPGSEVRFSNNKNDYRAPYYYSDFEQHEPLDAKLENLLKYVDIEPIDQKPGLILGYIPDIDEFGHYFGYPITSDVYDKSNLEGFYELLGRVDHFFLKLFQKLSERNKLQSTNILIVSDHGMNNVQYPDNILIWEDLLDSDTLTDKIQYVLKEGPMISIGLYDSQEWPSIYDELKTNLEPFDDNFHVYHKGSFPKHLLYNAGNFESKKGDIWIIPDPNFSMVTRDEYNKILSIHDMVIPASSLSFQFGTHGYDRFAEDMKAIFIGSGPYFNEVELEYINNTDVRNLLIELCGFGHLVEQKDKFKNKYY